MLLLRWMGHPVIDGTRHRMANNGKDKAKADSSALLRKDNFYFTTGTI
jgi:hypothetical protein